MIGNEPPPAERRAALTARKNNRLAPPAPASEDLVATAQNLVQRLGPERRALRNPAADLLDVFLPALADPVPQALPQPSVPPPLLAPLRTGQHSVRHARPG